MPAFGLVGQLTALPGRRDALAALLLEAAEALRGVAGCTHWVVHAPVADPDTVWVTEAWRSRKDHRESLALPAVRAIIAQAMPLLARPPESFETTPLGGVGL